MSITEMVKDGKKVHFVYFREGNLYYETECGFRFPVPLSDVGTATFNAEDKAMLFMRWIRKHMKVVEEGKQV